MLVVLLLMQCLLKNDGNVGIGTTAPSAKLHVSGNTKLTGGTFQVSSDGSVGSGFSYSFRDAVGISNPNSLSAPSVAGFVMSVGRSTSSGVGGGIYVEGESKFIRGIGLGTTGIYATSHSLNIDGTGLAIKNNTSGSNNNWSVIKNTATGSAANLALVTGQGIALTLNNDKSANFASNITVSGGQILTPSSVNLALNPNTGVVAVGGIIRASGTGSSYFTGSLGIGTTSPSHPLDVKGADTDNATIARFYSNTGARGSFVIKNGVATSPTTYIGTAAGSEELAIGTEGTEVIRIDASQRVGIGTTSPVSLLQVGNPMTRNILTIGGIYSSGGAALNFRSGHPSNSAIWNMAEINVTDDGNFNGRIEFKTTTAGGNSGVTPTQKMVIKANGKVGIGTTAPNVELHISGAGSPGIKIQDSDGTNQFLLLEHNNGSSTYVSQNNTSNGSHVFYGSTAGNVPTERMRITSAGNVGIGTIGYAQKPLDVSGATGGQLLITSADDSVGSTAGILLRSEAGEANGLARVKGGIFFERIAGTFGNGDLKFAVNTNANNNIVTVADTKMTITSAGNVGIGTTSPSAPLEVAGNLLISTTSGTPASGTNGLIIDHAAVIGGGTNSRFYSRGDATNRGGFQFNQLKNDNTASITSLSIDSSGNVGIGTTSPANKLNVVEGTSNWEVAEFQSSSTTGAGITLIPANINSLQWSIIGQGTSGGANDNNLGFHLTGVGTSGGSAGYKMTLQASSGNLGIGTANPTSLLHLSDATSPTLKIVDTTNDVTLLAFSQDSSAGFGTFSAHQLNFYVNSSASMVINGSQNVGIGLTADIGKLGTVNFGGVRLHIKGATTIARAVLEGSIQATVLMRVSGNTAAADSKIKFIQSKGGEYRMGAVDDDGDERTQLSIENNGDTHIESGDLQVDTANKGLILKSANGTRFRITVSNSGQLGTTQI